MENKLCECTQKIRYIENGKCRDCGKYVFPQDDVWKDMFTMGDFTHGRFDVEDFLGDEEEPAEDDCE